MDVLGYAEAGYEPEEDPKWREVHRPSHRQWTEIGRELNATVVPFSFWRSRLPQTACWFPCAAGSGGTIALDEVENELLAASSGSGCLFRFEFLPIRFQVKTGPGNWASGFIETSVHSLTEMTRVWVEPRFNSRCSVFASSPTGMEKIMADESLRARILGFPPFALHCSHEHGDFHRGLLSLRIRYPGVDLEWARGAAELMHAILLRLKATGLATGDGVPWTLGV